MLSPYLPESFRNKSVDSVKHWIEKGSWLGPEPGGENIDKLNIDQENSRTDTDQERSMAYSLIRKRSTPSVSKNESDITGVSLREGKNPAVKNRRYEQLL